MATLSVRRFIRLVVPLLLVALVVAAAALAGRGDPKRAITEADQARAKAMMLRKADLSSAFRATPSGGESDFYCAAFDESDLTLTGDAESPVFTLAPGGVLVRIVGSAGRIYRTVSDADASWRRNTSAAGERCGRIELQSVIRNTGGQLVSFGRRAFPRLAPRTVAYHVVGAVPGSPGTINFDFVFLQRQRAQVEIVVFTKGEPVSKAELVRFARIVADRQRAVLD